MNELLQNLLKLQTLEFAGTVAAETEKHIAELRAKIPAQILGHYDRLVARGKKGLAIIRNQVCTGCHMQVPRGSVLTLMGGKDIQICESCGRYLYLPVPAETGLLDAREAEKPARKTRRREAVLNAA